MHACVCWNNVIMYQYVCVGGGGGGRGGNTWAVCVCVGVLGIECVVCMSVQCTFVCVCVL